MIVTVQKIQLKGIHEMIKRQQNSMDLKNSRNTRKGNSRVKGEEKVLCFIEFISNRKL
jgi:hypothetical protein